MSDPTTPDWQTTGIRIVHGNDFDVNTPQTPGMTRTAAITNASAGAEKLWAGTVTIDPKPPPWVWVRETMLPARSAVEMWLVQLIGSGATIFPGFGDFRPRFSRRFSIAM